MKKEETIAGGGGMHQMGTAKTKPKVKHRSLDKIIGDTIRQRSAYKKHLKKQKAEKKAKTISNYQKHLGGRPYSKGEVKKDGMIWTGLTKDGDFKSARSVPKDRPPKPSKKSW